ncbi:MAG: ankyrin repeat domain-containing protein [Nitrospirales bacterium]
MQSVMELLDAEENILVTNSMGWTVLHYAARAGRDTIVKLLLDK